MKDFMVPNTFDPNWNGNGTEKKLKIEHWIYRIQCASVNTMLRQARLNYYSEKKHRIVIQKYILVAKHLLECSN